MVKTFVWLSIAFLLGGITAVTYFTLFVQEHKDATTVTSEAKYVSVSAQYNEYPMKHLDSLTARSNEKFTRRNAVNHPSPVNFKQL